MLRTSGSPRERGRINAAMLSFVDSLGLDVLNLARADAREIANAAFTPSRMRIPRILPAVVPVERNGARIDVVLLGEVSDSVLAQRAASPTGAIARDPRAALVVGLAALDRVRPEGIVALHPDLDLLIVSDGKTSRRAARLVDSTIVAFAPAQGQHLGLIERAPDGSIREEWLSLFDPSLTDRAVELRVAALNRAARAIQEAEAKARKSVPLDTRWAGGDACAACHEDAAAAWKKTGHARAMATLVRAEKDFDRECLGCHVTAWEDGYVDPVNTPDLADVQCEACHGPGAAHASDPGQARMGRTEDGLCLRCHTQENSPAFDRSRYMERIRHWR